jgi:hypothetical protein
MARLRKSARSLSGDRLENPPQKPFPDPRFRRSGITIQRSLIPRSASLRLKKTGFACKNTASCERGFGLAASSRR